MEDGAGANSSMIYIPLDQAHDVLDAFGEAYITSSSSSEDQNEEDEDEHLDLSTVMDFNIPNPMPNPSVMAISLILNQELEVDVDDIGTPYFWERDDRGGGVYSDGEEYQEIDDGSNVKPRYIFQDREVWQLRERGLLGDIRGEGGRGWGRVSRDVMHDTIYYAERERERERDRGRERGFRNWEDLPMELKLMVLDFCGDEECVSLGMSFL
jgi:hypothetical protein